MYIGFLRSRFETPRRSLRPALLFGSLWGAIGLPGGALGHTLGHLGLHWGVLGMPWDHFGTPWARCWHVWGSFWDILELWCPQEPPPQADGSQVPRLRTKTSLLEFARRSNRSRRSRRFRRNGPRTTVQDLPSTRAGDQDDVSFTNSLKLTMHIRERQLQPHLKQKVA